MDPIQLRIINHTVEDPLKKNILREYLRECYKLGADKFGGHNGDRAAVRNGKQIGWASGMATATYLAMAGCRCKKIKK